MTKLSIFRIFNMAVLSAAALVGVTSATEKVDAAAWYNCKPISVFEFSGELEVNCSNNYSGSINWIGATISSLTSTQQARFVSMAEAAILSGKTFRVFMTDTQCPVAGANCRIANSWSLYPAQ